MKKGLTVLEQDLFNEIRKNAVHPVSHFAIIPGVIFGYFVAKSGFAYRLMGLPDDAGSYNKDIPFIEAFVPGGPKNSKNNCFVAQACAITEGTCRAVRDQYGRCSSDLPENKVPKNASNEKGGVCFDIVCDNYGGTNNKFDAFEVCFDDTRKLVVMRFYITAKINGCGGDSNQYNSLLARFAIERFAKRKSGLYVMGPV